MGTFGTKISTFFWYNKSAVKRGDLPHHHGTYLNKIAARLKGAQAEAWGVDNPIKNN